MPGSVPAAAQATPIVSPVFRVPIVDANGNAARTTMQFMQQLFNFVVSMNRIIPCSCTNVGNVYTLTMLPSQPLLTQYNDFDTFSFVASGTSGAAVTAKVVTANGTLATLNVYKTNGSAQAGLNDVTSGLHYMATYVDSLNSGAGGFVLR